MAKKRTTPDGERIRLRTETVPIDSLKPDPRNARLHGQKNMESITASLRRFGQQKPIVIGADNVIRAGNGTWTAAKDLGWTTIDVVRSNLSAADLKAFAIADNRSAELADWDAEELDRTMQELSSLEIPPVDLGFDEGQLEALVAGNVREAHGFIPPKEKKPPAAPALDESYQIVVTCRDEPHQADLLDRFEQEGLQCRALMT